MHSQGTVYVENFWNLKYSIIIFVFIYLFIYLLIVNVKAKPLKLSESGNFAAYCMYSAPNYSYGILL